MSNNTKRKIPKKKKTIAYFTKDLLLEATNNYEAWGYNQGLKPEYVANLSPDIKFTLTTESFVHEHKKGKPCEKHYRCVITLNQNGDRGLVDVPMEFYFNLPTIEV